MDDPASSSSGSYVSTSAASTVTIGMMLEESVVDTRSVEFVKAVRV